MTDRQTLSSSRRAKADRFVLALIGIGFVAAPFLCLLAVAVAHADGYDWPDQAVVPVDGRAHAVTVDDGRDVMLWTEGGGDASDCTVSDASDGAPLVAAPADGSHHRNGKVSDWIGTLTFTPRSPAVEVTCAATSPTFVGVQSVPRVPAFVAGFSAWFLVRRPDGRGRGVAGGRTRGRPDGHAVTDVQPAVPST